MEETPSRTAHRSSSAARHRSHDRSLTSGIIVLVVTAVAGTLFGISAANARSRGAAAELTLTGLVAEQQRVVEQLEEDTERLRSENTLLLGQEFPESAEVVASLDNRGELVGPGLTVSLDDSPPDFKLDESTNVNVAVVHQQDVDAVMNALWEGGAEAMSVQDVRITSTTPVRCVGNVILVGSTSFAPPYRVTAIGDVSGMLRALDTDPAVGLYREDAARYGLGWRVQTTDRVTIPAASPASLRYARVKEEA